MQQMKAERMTLDEQQKNTTNLNLYFYAFSTIV